ncbi:Druantia anti-phage system protein DruA [Bradyrhizobium sp. G127]|uniref:Druantia anti-phage system protein DruA n=1 Tax=Bradyrhizobium sp. G127 TaxID=2904800 RepID=UPI001F22B6B0|nr:Druantia anti-phage system protein DruA [Bradyrhizobium sp. G127]MCF2525397.1 DUF4338 domain-containing protein [Bradyrhizobium sp. G127]
MKRKSKKPNVAKVNLRRAALVRKFRRHLSSLGFRRTKGVLTFEGSGKDVIRGLHSEHRGDRIDAHRQFIAENFDGLKKYFAGGQDIDPAKITPRLELVKSGTWQSKLFRLASLTWSVPVSNGFGRRLRYLVWDKQNDKLIGLLAIGDPVFNLSVRDKLIGWNSKERGSRLVNVMDAYVLGSIPPYNQLLGGKLVASLVRTREIYNDFAKAYGDTRGIISKKKKNARLLVVTTSSSLGRSSIYNRLKLSDQKYFRPIGFTGGWGHFHIPDDLFADMRSYLRDIGHPYADLHRYGQGPNWRMRTTRAALSALGYKDDMLRHGIQREVYLCEFATNSLKILKTGTGRPNLKGLKTVEEVSRLAVQRWMVPRAERLPEFRLWEVGDIMQLLGRKVAAPKVISMK